MITPDDLTKEEIEVFERILQKAKDKCKYINDYRQICFITEQDCIFHCRGACSVYSIESDLEV